MATPLHVLIVEDTEDDALLMIRELRRGGYEPIYERVETRAAMQSALDKTKWDVILCDYSLPHFSGPEALAFVKERGLDIPFIIVTGTIRDAEAVSSMKNGAHDYILKGNLTRLPAAIERELREAITRRERRLAEEMLKASEERSRNILETAQDAIICLEYSGKISIWNKKAEEMFGYPPAEMIGNDLHKIIVPERYREKAYEGLETFFRTGAGPVVGKTVELSALRKDGTEFPIALSISAMRIRGEWQATGIIRDITERKQAEEKLRSEIEVTSNLLGITEITSHTIDINKLMEQVMQYGSKIVGCDTCLSYLWNKETKIFQPDQCHGLPSGLIPMFHTQILDEQSEFVKRAIEGKKPVVISAAGLKGEGLRTEIPQSIIFPWFPDFNTSVLIPLIGKEGCLGFVVAIFKNSREFTEKDLRIISGISNQVSIALEQARLYKESVDKTMELSHKIETINVMHEIDRGILSTLDTQEILETITSMVTRLIPAERVTVVLVDRERGGFIYKAEFGVKLAKGAFVSFGDTSATEVIQSGTPQFTSDIASEKDRLPLERALLDEGYHAHIRVPLTIEGEIVGLFNVGSKKVGAFVSEHLTVLERLAAQTSVALKNARLVTDLKDMFLGTITTLSSAIDAKSPWTAGHSKRVTRYALDMGKEMGLHAKDLKDLEMAGLLHDTGKLGTYQSILDKSYKLTEKETKVMRLHPAKGAEILSPIKQMREIIPAIRHHHEFYNGGGYPDGLKGEAIPLMARILGVADSVDAMSADRPYRKGKPMNVIIAELKRCSGTQFDPKVADVFVKMAEGGKLVTV